MNIKPFLNTAQKFVTDNSPGILTGLAVAGTVTTAVLAGKAAYQIGRKVQSEVEREVDDVPNWDSHVLRDHWKEFIPPAVTGVATIVCIIGATSISTRRTAAIAAAFKLSEDLAQEYKDKVVEKLGAQKEEKLRAELAQERITQIGGAENVIIVGSQVLFHDTLSGRVFQQEMSKVEKAVNEINYQINNFYHASLTEFYEKIGLSGTKFSDEVGWNSDALLEPRYSATVIDDRPAISIEFRTTPIRGFDRCH
jgi:hypothetical protein